MSENFSQELCACLEKREIIKSKNSERDFLKNTGIDSVEFDDFLSGKILPSEEKLNRIIRKAKLTKEEKGRLKAKFSEARKNDENNAEIVNILNFFRTVSCTPANFEIDVNSIARRYKTTKNKADTYSLMTKVLEEENGKIRIVINNEVQILKGVIAPVLSCKTSATELILCLNEVDTFEEKSKNLECIEAAAQLQTQNDNLKTKYFRRKMFADDNISGGFPFIILTSRCALMLSSDFVMSFLITDEEKLAACLREFKQIEECSKALIHSSDDNGGYANVRRFICEAEHENVYVLSYAPEIMLFMEKEELGQILRDDIEHRDRVVQRLCNVWDDFKSSDSVYLFFTKHGLLEFAQNGIMHEYGSLFNPLSVEQRCKILKNIRTTISMERLSRRKYMLANENICLSPVVSMFFTDRKILGIYLSCDKAGKQLTLNNSVEFKKLAAFDFKNISGEGADRTVVTTDELIAFLDTLIKTCGGEKQ